MQRWIYGMLADRLSFRRLCWCFRPGSLVPPWPQFPSARKDPLLTSRFLLSRGNWVPRQRKKLFRSRFAVSLASVRLESSFSQSVCLLSIISLHLLSLSIICRLSSSSSFVVILCLWFYELQEPLVSELQVSLISWTWPWCLPCCFYAEPNLDPIRREVALAWLARVWLMPALGF